MVFTVIEIPNQFETSMSVLKNGIVRVIRTQSIRILSPHYSSIRVLKATLPNCSTVVHFALAKFVDIRNQSGYFTLTVTVLSVVPPLALVAVDGLEVRGKNLACTHSPMGRMRCSLAVAEMRESAAVASTVGAVVAGLGGEHAVEADRSAVVGADWDGSVPAMVPIRNCCGLLGAVYRVEEVRSGACFGCNMLRSDLP